MVDETSSQNFILRFHLPSDSLAWVEGWAFHQRRATCLPNLFSDFQANQTNVYFEKTVPDSDFWNLVIIHVQTYRLLIFLFFHSHANMTQAWFSDFLVTIKTFQLFLPAAFLRWKSTWVTYMDFWNESFI